MNRWFVYILLCQGNTFYTGISPDPEKRFLIHQSGKGSKYTRSHKPIKIVYTEQLENRSEALKREAQIKKWSRAKKIKEFELHETASLVIS